MTDQTPSNSSTPQSGGAPQAGPAGAALPLGRPAAASLEPAVFPRGFWAQLDYLLRHPERVLESIRRDEGLTPIILICLAISIVMGAIYGVEMGATNFLQGSPMDAGHKALLVLVTAVKVPCLFLLTLLIVWPPIYVSNAFMGARNSWRQITAMLLGGTAISSTMLASMVTVSFFFTLTSREYDFIKLLHVLFFAYAGIVGLIFLQRCIGQLSPSLNTRRLAFLWLLLYIFVGTQLAWVMRPFVGSPNEPFQVFRPRSGNFYESVMGSVKELMRK